MTETGFALDDSSSFSYKWRYDVFINFRGKDTRYGFTGNLNNALKEMGVDTFFDEEDLKIGDTIKPALLDAIENSRMAITVFSKTYAASPFCLDELVQIHECIKRKGRLVLPIFYDVAPAVVRYQTDDYETDLSKIKGEGWADEDKIQRWKLALKEVADTAGLHFVYGESGYEYQVIERIVKVISSKITRGPLHVSEYPVGLEYRVKEITSLLQIGSNDKVIMVGICGMGGLGKSTIARAMYNSIADNFEGLCFLHDVKGELEKLGLKQIQERILSKIVGVDIKIEDVNAGVQAIKKRFKEKKILLILDNVENHEQLKKLAGGCDWFSAGSRIIITTRDEQLLVAHGVESIYDMKVFNVKESLELLSWNAFRNRQVDPCYKDVLNRVVTYARGLPLALEVIGSSLCGKTINEWESALEVYKLSPHKDIQQVLRLSYDVLDAVEKEIVLDIACLFNGEHLEYVKYMVEAVYNFKNLSYSIGVLVNKRLIKIGKWYNRILMHDLIRDMGRKIVLEESPNNPGERSRLWFHPDIVHVLESNTGTNKVRMIGQRNWSECIEVNWDGEAFKSMKELKILIFENVKFSEDPKYLPESLKVLKWRRYTSCFSPNFSLKKLVVLDIGYSCLSSLERITKTSDNLGILNLVDCKYVKEIPDVWNLRNLKKLSLRGCENLIEIHDSVGYLQKLEILNVDGCVRLETFPRAIKLPSLTILDLGFCSSLKYFPEILGKMKIKRLRLPGTGIEKLPWSICNLSELWELFIDQEKSVIEIPNSIFLLPEIEHITVKGTGKVISFNSKEGQEHAIWSKQCPNEVHFNLPRSNISDDVLRTDISRYKNVLWSLNLSGNDFTILPAWMKECPFLKILELNECRHLREVEGIPPRIRRLEAINCVSLSLESRSILLSEESHRPPGRYNNKPVLQGSCFFYVPSKSIPKWFDHRSKGASISFWFRNSLPPLRLCVLLKAADVTYFEVSLHFDEEPLLDQALFYSERFKLSYTVEDHLAVCKVYMDRVFIGRRLRLGDRWHHGKVCVRLYRKDEAKDRFIEETGLYVIKQLFEVEDISFIDPYHQT